MRGEAARLRKSALNKKSKRTLHQSITLKLWMLRSLDAKEVANKRAKTVTALQLLR
jgi:hypothetical protein